MRQLVNALLWLHKRNIAHLDIKPENVMINTGILSAQLSTSSSASPTINTASIPTRSNYKPLLKLIDFGESVGTVSRDTILTPSHLEFSAPERIIGQALGSYTDSWGFGILLYTFLSGVSPFLDDSIEETTANIIKCDFSFPDEHFQNISNDAKNLLTKLLVLETNGRATMSECQISAWFTQVKYILLNKLNRNVFLIKICFNLFFFFSNRNRP